MVSAAKLWPVQAPLEHSPVHQPVPRLLAPQTAPPWA